MLAKEMLKNLGCVTVKYGNKIIVYVPALRVPSYGTNHQKGKGYMNLVMTILMENF